MSTERRLLLAAKGLTLYGESGPPYRELWLSGDLQAWCDNELVDAAPPSQDGGWVGSDEPIEQVYAAFEEYAYNPAYKGVNLLVNIMPQRHGVWEIKTHDIRILGWFYRYRVFIAHVGALKSDIDYNKCLHAVRNFRSGLRLTRPPFLFISGGKPRDYF